MFIVITHDTIQIHLWNVFHVGACAQILHMDCVFCARGACRLSLGSEWSAKSPKHAFGPKWRPSATQMRQKVLPSNLFKFCRFLMGTSFFTFAKKKSRNCENMISPNNVQGKNRFSLCFFKTTSWHFLKSHREKCIFPQHIMAKNIVLPFVKTNPAIANTK